MNDAGPTPRSRAWSAQLLAAARAVTDQLRDRELQRLARRNAETAAAADLQRSGSNGSALDDAIGSAPDNGAVA